MQLRSWSVYAHLYVVYAKKWSFVRKPGCEALPLLQQLRQFHPTIDEQMACIKV